MKPLIWLASAKHDLRTFPVNARRKIGFGLDQAQRGAQADNAKPMHGYGSGVYEIVADSGAATYRGVYVVRFKGLVYVLHCFQKKSHRGSQTPRPDRVLIEQRLKEAHADYDKRNT